MKIMQITSNYRSQNSNSNVKMSKTPSFGMNASRLSVDDVYSGIQLIAPTEKHSNAEQKIIDAAKELLLGLRLKKEQPSGLLFNIDKKLKELEPEINSKGSIL